jgi:hypothetical protein
LYRLFVLFGGLIVVALFTALIAPYFIDWEAYKERFERQAGTILGQPVTVGEVSRVRILPLPSLTFSRISVGSYPDGQPMMTAKDFSLNAELMPFLSGEVRIVDMTIVEPQIAVRIGEQGEIAWTARQQMVVDPQRVKLEAVNVVGGSLTIDGLFGGRQVHARNIEAAINAQSLYGPWRIDARGEVEGVASQFLIQTGRLQEEGSLRVRFSARRMDQPYRLSLDGPIALTEGVLAWDGAFEFKPETSAEAEAQGPWENVPEDVALAGEPLPAVVTGSFQARPQSVEAPDFRLEIGPRDDPYTITGSGRALFRERLQFGIEGEGRQIDLDRLEEARQRQEAGEAQPLEAGGLERRIEALRYVVDRIPVPQADGEISLSLPAILAGDTAVREVSLLVRPARDRWHIRKLSAVFPGNTTVEAEGRLGARENFGFTGNLLLASRQPTGFAAWLSGSNNAALRRLRRAGFQAYADITPNVATFDNLELQLDDVTLSGRLQRLAAVDGRPGILAQFSGDLINIDDLVAIYSLTRSDGGEGISNHDIDVALKAGVLQGSGLEARGVDAHVRVQAGSVTIDRLDAQEFYGAAISSSGRLADLPANPNGNFSLRVEAQDGSSLAALARQRLGDNAFLDALANDKELSRDLLAVLDIEARPALDASRGIVNISGRVGGTEFEFRDRFEGEASKWLDGRHDFALKLKQESPDILARQLALPVLPLAPPGPVEIGLDASGDRGEGFAVSFSAQAPGADLSAKGRVVPVADDAVPEAAALGGIATADLEIAFGARDIEPWMQMAGYPLPGAGEGNPASARFALTAEPGKAQLRSISASYGGNSISGDLAADWMRAGRPLVTGDLDLSGVSLPFLAELRLGPGTVDAASGADEETQFGKPLLDGVDAQIGLRAARLDAGFGPEATVFSGRLELADQRLGINGMRADWIGGTFGGNVSLSADQGNAVFNAQLSASGMDAAPLAALAGYPGLASGKTNLTATLDASGRSMKAMKASLSGSGVLELQDALISGISARGLPQILAESEAEGFEVKPETVAPLAQQHVLAGSFPVPFFSGAFSVNQGEAVLRNATVRAEGGGVLDAEAAVDIRSGEVTAAASIRLEEGAEALAGAEPGAAFRFGGTPGEMRIETDASALEGYLALRSFEKEQRRVDLLQANVLERQRLRRETILANARIAARTKAREEELQELEDLQRLLEEQAAPTPQERPAGEDTQTQQPAPRDGSGAGLFDDIDRKLQGN